MKFIQEGENTLKHSIHELDNPALAGVSCSPDYFRSLTQDCLEALNSTVGVNHDNPALVIILSSRISHRLSTYLLQGRATSNTSPDIMFGERKSSFCLLKFINYMHFVL